MEKETLKLREPPVEKGHCSYHCSSSLDDCPECLALSLKSRPPGKFSGGLQVPGKGHVWLVGTRKAAAEVGAVQQGQSAVSPAWQRQLRASALTSLRVSLPGQGPGAQSPLP